MRPTTWAHPKFHRLASLVGGDQIKAAGLLERIWYLAGTFDPDTGKLPGEAAWLLVGLGLADPAAAVAALIESGWIDETPAGLACHDWDEHRPNYLAKRARAAKAYDEKRAAAKSSSKVADCNNSAQNPDGSAPSMFNVQCSGSDSDPFGSPYVPMETQDGLVWTLGEADAADAARRIFAACGYRGAKGRQLWKAAALFECRLISEDHWQRAAESTRNNARRNKPAYFYKALKRLVPDLEQRAAAVRIEPTWPAIYPGD